MFYISRIAQMKPDTMPVIKTTCYPWTDDSFKPLMYCRCGVLSSGAAFDLMCFEREPKCDAVTAEQIDDDSCAALCFNFFPERSDKLISATVNASGIMRLEVIDNGRPEQLPPMPVSTYGGADEQGWYWGVRFEFSLSLLNDVYGVSDLDSGHIMKGNAYKFLRAGKYSHLGAVAPVGKELFSPSSLADFTIL